MHFERKLCVAAVDNLPRKHKRFNEETRIQSSNILPSKPLIMEGAGNRTVQ